MNDTNLYLLHGNQHSQLMLAKALKLQQQKYTQQLCHSIHIPPPLVIFQAFLRKSTRENDTTQKLKSHPSKQQI